MGFSVFMHVFYSWGSELSNVLFKFHSGVYQALFICYPGNAANCSRCGLLVFLNRRGIRVVSSEKQQNLGPFSLENFNLAFISVGLLLDHYHHKTTSTDGSCFNWRKTRQNFHFHTICYRKLVKVGTGMSDGFSNQSFHLGIGFLLRIQQVLRLGIKKTHLYIVCSLNMTSIFKKIKG